MDNGPPEIISDLARLGLHRPQVREGVNACRVAALEGDLECVLTDQHDVFDAQLFRRERLDPRQSPRCACLTPTFGAGTCPAQLLRGVRGVLTAFPRDLHRLAGAVDVDVDRERIGILQLCSA